MPTLLEQAKLVKQERHSRYKQITEEHIELAIAWGKGSVTPTQIAAVVRGAEGQAKSGNILYHLASWFREGIQRGYLVEAKPRKEK